MLLTQLAVESAFTTALGDGGVTVGNKAHDLTESSTQDASSKTGVTEWRRFTAALTRTDYEKKRHK